MLAAFLFTGCDTGNGGSDVIVGLDSRLIGTWELSGEGWSERYEITETHFTYTGFETWGGSIAYAARFNNNTGVIIIQYDADKKQQWTNWTTMEDITPAGNFYGIYFRNLTQNSVVLSNTSDQADNWGPSETTTQQQAINRFTFDNMSNWIDLSFASPLDRVQ